ncbi:MAG TPA: tyrosine-type recombinase/integrase [Chloroflexia bacterium]|nr:tyrosine-type recombinase/integrase [Chloroflexia bacterium]
MLCAVRDLVNTNCSKHTLRNYRIDLRQFLEFVLPGETAISTVGVNQVRNWLSALGELSAASRARKQASLSSLFKWAVKFDYLPVNPTDKIDRIKLPISVPRGVGRKKVEKIIKAIPAENLRDRLLFSLIFETGLRASEALTLHIEDLDLTHDDEHMTVLGKGNRRRTVLLDDRTLVLLLKKYLKQTGYQHGPLFRATKNDTGGPLRYQSIHELWQKYCSRAGVGNITLHQLRHTHATELVNECVSLSTIKRRLGHSNMQTTLRYAEQIDATADRELREWRRKKDVRNVDIV